MTHERPPALKLSPLGQGQASSCDRPLWYPELPYQHQTRELYRNTGGCPAANPPGSITGAPRATQGLGGQFSPEAEFVWQATTLQGQIKLGWTTPLVSEPAVPTLDGNLSFMEELLRRLRSWHFPRDKHELTAEPSFCRAFPPPSVMELDSTPLIMFKQFGLGSASGLVQAHQPCAPKAVREPLPDSTPAAAVPK